MDPEKIRELAKLLRDNGDKILNSEFTLTLSGSLLRALNDSFTLIADSTEIGGPHTFQVVKPINSSSPVFRDLQLVHDFVQKTTLLCIVHYPGEDYFEGIIDISKFRALRRLEVRKTNIKQIVGIQPLRSQLQQLICTKSLNRVDEVITHCGGDNSNGFVWNELKFADFSYNNLQTVDISLEFAQYLQHLNLRHNQLYSVEAIKWLPHLKSLDLSFNRLPCIPQFHMEAYKRLQTLNMSNNFLEDLMGSTKLDSLTDLDLSDNCLLDHSCLLPLSALATLKFLNLSGNPLHCHPKHRVATAQFLHKNTSTVKFVLDFEELSKYEKSLTGSLQMRHVGAFPIKSSSASINTDRMTPSSQTPASSVGSLRSFKFQESINEAESATNVFDANAKRRCLKVRTVEIQDGESSNQKSSAETTPTNLRERSTRRPNNQSIRSDDFTDHLETKKHIETLREKYGAEWLQSGNAETMQSVFGLCNIKQGPESQKDDHDVIACRQEFKDFLGEFSGTPSEGRSSTPINENFVDAASNGSKTITSIPSNGIEDGGSLYQSVDPSNETIYKTVDGSDSEIIGEVEGNAHAKEDKNAVEPPHLKDVYKISMTDDKQNESDSEDDEDVYIVYVAHSKEPIFLTISSNFLRERDSLTQRTKTKWGLKILESCDRVKSDTLRINFDTVKIDKRERVYTVEDGLCQELEKKLRGILSQRDLTEMNQTIYRCLNCSCQFCRENKYNAILNEIRCPDCRSTFVAEIQGIPRSLEKASEMEIGVSAASTEEEDKPSMAALMKNQLPREGSDETQSSSIGSANSLVASSSCSKITNSPSSFDSNQSVAGSSNTERDLEFANNCESDVDIISNPSQSSIEVLDPMHVSSRKTSEERRISQVPNLETIDDNSFSQSFTESSSIIESAKSREQPAGAEEDGDERDLTKKLSTTSSTKSDGKPLGGILAHVNLTESSSSGSVADSVCTAYEQQDKAASAEMLQKERSNNEKSMSDARMSDSSDARLDNSGVSTMLGALIQSTNVLMSGSKKLLDFETSSNIKAGTVLPSSSSTSSSSSTKAKNARCSKPYKFNTADFNDIDHRLKLYFYQMKFEEEGEHFKWIVRGRIYIENTHTLHDGIVVMSTCKLYLVEAYASEHDDVTKWLRQVVSVTVDRLECIQLLPWKVGVSFLLKGWGGFLLLLQDILRTDSLLLYFANNALPSQCELKYQPAEQILKRLNGAAGDEKLTMCSILNGCEVQCGSAKRQFNVCCLLTTDNRLLIGAEKLAWLSRKSDDADSCDLELSVSQLMSNLVEIERPAENIVVINFLDETQDQCELWRCVFETKENADSCLNAISQSWEQIFGVPLTNT